MCVTPFPRFFNLEADEVSIDELCARSMRWEATEKLNGSLGLLAHVGGEWRVLTQRSCHSEQAQWAERRLRSCAVAALTEGTSYLCEILFRANLVAVRYADEDEGVYLLGAYDARGVELSRTQVEAAAAASGLRCVPLVGCGALPATNGAAALRALVRAVRAAPDGSAREGVVLRFQLADGSAHRVRVRADAYCRLARVQHALTPHAALVDARNGLDALSALGAGAPADFTPYVSRLRAHVLVGVALVVAQAHRAVALAADAGAADGAALARFLQLETRWRDGSLITPAQLALAHDAHAGRLGSAADARTSNDSLHVRAEAGARLLGQMDGAARLAVLQHVPVDALHGLDGSARAVCLADGTVLLNHQRPWGLRACPESGGRGGAIRDSEVLSTFARTGSRRAPPTPRAACAT